jgi:hypothetical protein
MRVGAGSITQLNDSLLSTAGDHFLHRFAHNLCVGYFMITVLVNTRIDDVAALTVRVEALESASPVNDSAIVTLSTTVGEY